MTDKEVELKLRVRPDDLGKLAGVPVLASGGPGSSGKLHSTYFDTEDLRLHRRGVSLRVRRQGRRFVQTVKLGGAPTGTHLARGEWETPVPGPAPDLGLLPEGAARAELALVTADELRPVFTAEVRRTTRTLSGNGAEIEAAIDRGEIRRADGAAEPVAELELELKAGSALDLYAVAIAVAESVPVRVETRTKSDRGYALAADARPAAVKARPVEIAADASVEQAFEAILRNCLSQVLANQHAAEAGAAEGIHQMRVGLRRMRSALVLFKRFLPPQQLAELGAEVKWLAGELGGARNWDVFLDQLLPPVEEALPGNPALAALRAEAVAARERGHARARAAILSQRCTLLLLRFGAWLEARSWRRQEVSEDSATLMQPVGVVAEALLSRRQRAARRRGKGFARLAAGPRHELRIALKKLRYATEFFRPLYSEDGRAVSRYLRQLSALQDALGHANDVATAGELLAELEAASGDRLPLPARTGSGLVVGWHARGLVDGEPELRAAWDDFADARPFWSRHRT
ncbi:CYTH and CHAD domain-containing protein [Arenibaculum pallidiluteum]|uniref:CYTH and CHAD domain-containing protein n=1 Tax=Arenibaculum pallidiluteum TaxID=2812559 RepID=UPI001A966586|nr:CYTH and CHAD domain-containing protein [Arenibaculum pallidiluteum]